MENKRKRMSIREERIKYNALSLDVYWNTWEVENIECV